MKRLYDRLTEYKNSDYYGFHMPGHKRNETLIGAELPYGIDITEIEGFDDLHHAQGILEMAQNRAAQVFGAGQTFFLVNGSTVGILSAILGCTRKGDKVLVARHCHKSIHHGIYLNELVSRYVYPYYDGRMHVNGEISAEDVAAALEAEPDIRAVVIVSPNYDGVVSDVRAIAQVVHDHGIPLIVDEAHGAHFGFHPYFPKRANDLGADVVINSLHKTLPSLTQTALLHINEGYADRRRIVKYLDMLQSSSPSYILMASLDACVAWLDKEGKDAFEVYVKRLEKLRNDLKNLRNLRILETEHYDKSKLVISVNNTNITSIELQNKLLNDYKLQMEMTARTYVLAMTSPADTEDGFLRLKNALMEIDGLVGTKVNVPDSKLQEHQMQELPRLEQVYTPFQIEEELVEASAVALKWKDAEGRIAVEYAYLYPPGSPVIIPGERISKDAVGLLEYYKEQGFEIEGLSEKGKIKVLKHG